MAKLSVHYDEQKDTYYLKLYNMIPSDDAVASHVGIKTQDMRTILEENFNAHIGGKKDEIFNPYTTFSTSEDIIKAIRWLDSLQVMQRLRK